MMKMAMMKVAMVGLGKSVRRFMWRVCPYLFAFACGSLITVWHFHELHYRDLIQTWTEEMTDTTRILDCVRFGNDTEARRVLSERAIELDGALRLNYPLAPSAFQNLDLLGEDRRSYSEMTEYSLHRILEWVPDIDVQRHEFEKRFLGGREAAPELSVSQWVGEARPLKSLRGQVVLLDFWGTWCAPCVAALPSLQSFHDEFRDEGLVVIAVHSSWKAEMAAQFLRDKHYTFLAAIDSGKTAEDYGVHAWPTRCLIGRRGRVVWCPDPAMPANSWKDDKTAQAEFREALEHALAEKWPPEGGQ